MKLQAPIALTLLALTSCATATNTAPATSEPAMAKHEVANDGFDEALAAELRADEHGMGQYVIAFLRAGPNRDRSPEETAELQKQHMANISRLAAEGVLVLAGPFLDDGELRGIYVFDVTDVEEARRLTETDPAIQAGSLTLELHPWYGSAALRQVNAIHESIAKTKI